ncbi:MAG: response regulator [Planctomycetota bacterium]
MTDPLKILLVEDNELNRDMLARRLKRRGFDVETAVDGQWALGALELMMPDVVLMDMNMPGMDGWEATRRIRQNAKFQTLPIIALTAHATPEDRQRCMDAGCSAFHVKPVSMDELIEVISSLVGG